MQRVARSDILDIAEYERQRAALRPRYLAIKARRRSVIGGDLTMLWENRDTAWYQIEEMMRTERMVEERAIRHELDTYNELVPGRDELKATLLIERPDAGERDARLRELVGLERCMALRVGGEHEVPARFDTRQMSPEKLSSVQFVSFRLGEAARAALLAGAPAEIVIAHPACSVAQPLTPEVLAELRADLLAP